MQYSVDADSELSIQSSAFTNWVRNHVAPAANTTFNPYLALLFVSLAGISAVRFVGSTLYLVLRLFGH